MIRVALEETELTVAQLAQLAQREPVILTRQGRPLVVIKNLSGRDWESIALANNPQFIRLIEEARRSYREKGGISIHDMRKELGISFSPRPAEKGKNAKKA
jgi:hypothetical protein